MEETAIEKEEGADFIARSFFHATLSTDSYLIVENTGVCPILYHLCVTSLRFTWLT